jgi:multidrug efflux pump
VVKASIEKVLTTLVEAVVLVFVVMFLFLQNIRYTIIPTIVVPGGAAGRLLHAAARRLFHQHALDVRHGARGRHPRRRRHRRGRERRTHHGRGGPAAEGSTRKAMSQISGAIIGITLVLMAVFVPMAFFPGSVGIIYRQFSSPWSPRSASPPSRAVADAGAVRDAAEARRSRPRPCEAGRVRLVQPHARGGKEGYSRTVGFSLKRTGRLMLVYVALLVGLSWAFVSLPGGFLPIDDQGFVTTDVQTPSDSSYPRTEAVIEKVEKYLAERPGVKDVTFLTGFSFSGQGMNTAQAFITLKDWSERGPKDSAAAIVNDINRDLSSSIRDAKISALQPPPIDNLGNSSGFSFRLQDRGQKGYPALMRAADQLIAEANASPVLQKVYIEGLPEAGVVNLVIDREKAGAFGVTFEDINNTISTNLGSNYINDFPNRGRMQRVVVQADARDRMRTEDILNYNVKNSRGQLVPFSSFATVEWARGPTQIAGFNYYPAVRISGEAKPGFTSGDAIAEMERLAGKLPRGFGYEWTGQSLQEKLSGSQAPFLLALSVFVVFLCLAALYESWTIPLAVLLTVPLGIVGAVAAAMLRGLPNDVYFTVGLITIIGLAAKDAILIIEFAKDLRKEGKPLVDATIEACRLRFRPILMTGLAFICGVLPMAIAHGAGGASQQALGSIVMGGMIAVVILALLMVPVFFVSVQRVLGGEIGSRLAAKDRRGVRAARAGEAIRRAVMPRAGGASSTPRPFRIQQTSLEYWITRSSAQVRTRRVMTAECEAQGFALRLLPQNLHQLPVHELVAAHDMPGHQRVARRCDVAHRAALPRAP